MVSETRRMVDVPARVIGLAVFLIGIGLLVVVFIWANQTLPAPGSSADHAPNWVSVLTRLAWELGRLFVLGFLASAIAGRGVQMYAVATRAEAINRSPLE